MKTLFVYYSYAILFTYKIFCAQEDYALGVIFLGPVSF